MSLQVTPITLPLPFGFGTVNSYLIKNGGGFMLIDTGMSNQRARLEEALTNADCRPGDLQLILLTHGDFDHAGNAAYLRQRYGGLITMHPADAVMVERGDMFLNRNKTNIFLRKMTPILFGFGRSKRFKPDLLVTDGDDLKCYGFHAHVCGFPGHSKGSIGLLTEAGDLFCGDLLDNVDAPELNTMMDDPVAAHASMEKLRSLAVETIFPGHGDPFSATDLA